MLRVAVAVIVMGLGIEVVAAQQPPSKEPRWLPEQGVNVVQREGTIELDGSIGWIRLNSVYSDFVLEFDFQLPTDASSASVSIRSRPGYERTSFPFYGYHLLLSNGDDFGRVQTDSVTTVPAKANVKPEVKPAGSWQHLRIEAEGHVLRIRLNDAPQLVFEKSSEFAGYVALHARRDKVAFRNIRIARIPLHEQQFESGILHPSAPGVRSPKLIREVKPFYPVDPLRADTAGKVELEAVVQEDGSVGDVRVTKPRDPDLNEAAIAAVKQWQFVPAQKDGHAIPLIVSVEVSFKAR